MATETQTQKSVDVDDKAPGSVSDFLVAPKKKRKNYVILALGEDFDPELAKSVESHIRNQYPQLAIASPRNSAELNRLMAKMISLLVIADEFHGSLEKTFSAVTQIKKKKAADGVPTLFLTYNEKELVKKYRQELMPFHEVDEFLSLANLQVPVFFMRIRSSLRGSAKRRSRRFTFDIPVTYYDLTTGKTLEGRLEDLSLHGAMLSASNGSVFSEGGQIRVNLNVANIQNASEGEFLRVRAKVRRLLISGNQAGISFESLNERQTLVLTKLISQLITKQMAAKRATIPMPKKENDKRTGAPKT